MAFNLGYVKLCNGDIQHIYTTRNRRPPVKRKTLPYKPEFLVEHASTMRQRELNRRFMEYLPKYDIEIPKAPSFRTLSRDYVDTVVDRLTQPARERFNFRYPLNDVYNDWQHVERERKMKLREVLDQMDGKTDSTAKTKKTKKRKTKDQEDENEEENKEKEAEGDNIANPDD